MIIELSHPSDPRYLLVDELPNRVTLDDLAEGRYGKPLLFAPGPVDAVYAQPDGFGTDWVRPSEAALRPAPTPTANATTEGR